jgi:hypothetical protein
VPVLDVVVAANLVVAEYRTTLIVVEIIVAQQFVLFGCLRNKYRHTSLNKSLSRLCRRITLRCLSMEKREVKAKQQDQTCRLPEENRQLLETEEVE